MKGGFKLNEVRSNVQALTTSPYGSTTADLYIVMDYPDMDDLRFGQLGEGMQGRYVKSYMESFRYKNYRIGCLASTVPIVNGKIDENKTEAILNGLPLLAEDIYKTDPKVIVMLGSTVIKKLFNDSRLSVAASRNRDNSLDVFDKEYTTVSTYSPKYLMGDHSNSEDTNNFFRDIGKSVRICNGTYVDIMTQNEISSCRTYDEFEKFVEENLYDDTIITFDYETNAIDPRREDFEIIGFSVANKGNDTDHKLRGTYVILKSVDYEMPEEDQKKSMLLLKRLLSNVEDRKGRTPGINVNNMIKERELNDGVKVGFDDGRSLEGKSVVHNFMYEGPATINVMDYELKYDNIDDTLVMAKLLNGGKTGAGLKYQAQNIGYPDWETDLDEYIHSFLNVAKPSNGKGVKHIYNNIILKGDWEKLYEFDLLVPSQLSSKFRLLLNNYVPKIIEKFKVPGSNDIIKCKDNIDNLEFPEMIKVMKSIRSFIDHPNKTNMNKFKDTFINDEDYNESMHKLFPELFDNFETLDLYDIKMNDPKAIDYIEASKDLCNKVSDYYGDTGSLKNVMNKIAEKIKEFPDTEWYGGSIIPYNWVPYRLLCKYGAIDSVATYDLESSLVHRMVNESDSEVNLFKGYETFLKQHYAGYAMELSGVFFNDDIATRDDLYYSNIAVKAHKRMMEFEPIKRYLLNKLRMDYLPEVLYNNPYLNNYFRDHHGRSIEYAGVIRGKETYKVNKVVPKTDDNGNVSYLDNGDIEYEVVGRGHIKYFSGGGTKSFTLDPLKDVDPSIIESIDRMVSERIQDEIDKTDNADDLKSFMNPSSTQGNDFENLKKAIGEIIITDRYKFLSSVRLVANWSHETGDESDLEKEMISKCKRYTSINLSYENPDDEEEQEYVRKNYVQMRKDMYPKLEELLDKYYVSIGSPTEYHLPTNRWGRETEDTTLYGAYCQGRFAEFTGTDEGSAINYYSALNLIPFDENDRNQWKDYPEYEFNVQMRLYKKARKIVTSYLNGTLGRANVWTVDKKKMLQGDRIVRREKRYNDFPKDKNGKAIIPDDKALIMQHKMSVCSAETGRWRAGMHTLPAGSSVKKIYTSRFNGTVFQPDFSQNEEALR